MSRKLPDIKEREQTLIKQRGLCLYCSEPLDGYVFRKGRVIWLELQWDHMVPYAYLGRNPEDNWAASCQICNQIKSDLHFNSIQAIREYIEQRREELGYSLYPPEGVRPEDWIPYEDNKSPIEDPVLYEKVSQLKDILPDSMRVTVRICPSCDCRFIAFGKERICDSCINPNERRRRTRERHYKKVELENEDYYLESVRLRS